MDASNYPFKCLNCGYDGFENCGTHCSCCGVVEPDWAKSEAAMSEAEMEKSTHKCEVVVVHPEPHPNADKLEVVMVYGYSVCVQKGGFKDGDLGVYIPPDSIVPMTERFRWVWEAKGYMPPPHDEGANVPEKYRRIKAKVLRGVISEGILVPLEDVGLHHNPTTSDCRYAEVGEDVASKIGVTHYNPPEITSMTGDCEVAPTKMYQEKKSRRPKTLRGWCRFIWHKMFPKQTIIGHEENTGLQIPNYDVDSWQRHGRLFIKNEQVYITEKIHGANAKFTFMNGRMYVGSHYQWKKDIPGSAFWAAMRQNPWIEQFCQSYPGMVIYGELVPTQKLNYGQKKGEYRIFGFDILDTIHGRWLDYGDVKTLGLLEPIYWVPIVAQVPYDETTIRQYADGNTLVPGGTHIREGIVIRPLAERSDPRFGRVVLKIVSTAYLASKHSDE